MENNAKTLTNTVYSSSVYVTSYTVTIQVPEEYVVVQEEYPIVFHTLTDQFTHQSVITLLICNLSHWFLFLMCIFYLLITLCTRLLEIKAELQSGRRNLKLKGSVSPSHSYASRILCETPPTGCLGEATPPPHRFISFTFLISLKHSKQRQETNIRTIK